MTYLINLYLNEKQLIKKSENLMAELIDLFRGKFFSKQKNFKYIRLLLMDF